MACGSSTAPRSPASARAGDGNGDGDGHGGFTLTDRAGRERHARRVVVATGFGRAHLPSIAGIEEAEGYGDVSVDRDDFTDQRVLIIGKGNSAFETADHLVERAAVIHVVGPRSINFAWRTHFIGHLRAVNNNFLDTYQLKTQNMVLDATVDNIERRGDELAVTLTYSRRDRTVELVYDRVIACTGFAMDASIFAPGCRPELTIADRFPRLTSAWESVNVPDLYFGGTLTQSRDFKHYTSAFIHGFRYGVRALQRILDRRYEGVGWPERRLPAEPGPLADAALARVNRSSALWQQYGFLCDVIVLDDDTARYCEEVPVDHVLDGGFGAGERFVTVTLEYGAGHDAIDPFDVAAGREWEADPSHEDRYLHPVVRAYEAAPGPRPAPAGGRVQRLVGRGQPPGAAHRLPGRGHDGPAAGAGLGQPWAIWASSSTCGSSRVRRRPSSTRSCTTTSRAVPRTRSRFGTTRLPTAGSHWCPGSCGAPPRRPWT